MSASRRRILGPRDHHHALFWLYTIKPITMGWIESGTPELETRSQYPLIIAVCVVSSVVMIIVVALRFYIRRARIGLDDIIVSCGMVSLSRAP